MSQVFAFALGLATTNSRGETLDCLFPMPCLRPTGAMAEAAATLDSGVSVITPERAAEIASASGAALLPEVALNADRPITAVRVDEDGPIGSTAEAYLKLKEQEIRHVLWIAECIKSGMRERASEFASPL